MRHVHVALPGQGSIASTASASASMYAVLGNTYMLRLTSMPRSL